MFIQELCDRYNLKTTKTLYSRINALEMTLSKVGNKSKATEEQTQLLDEQHEYLKKGGTLKLFEPAARVQVTALKDTASHIHDTQHNPDTASIVETTQHTPQLSTQSVLLGDIVQNISQAIAEKMQPVDPLWYLPKLEMARANNWELTTSQVKELIGVKPSCPKGKKTFKRGSFIFVKSGKIGNQTAWKVQKVNESNYKVED